MVAIRLILYSLGESCRVIGFNKDVSRHSLNGKAEATQKEREQKGHQVKLTSANN
jgi:hypothetical protein